MEKSILLQGLMRLQLLMIICPLLVINTEAQFVNITILHSAVSKGAVCLDGSAPAYYYVPGKDSGAKNWLIYLQGGGWCTSDGMCLARVKTNIGSSYKMDSRQYFEGLLSGKSTVNPDFYNWNRVLVAYCDGSSFMSDVEAVDPKTNLTLRGNRIFEAVMEELLLNKGMKDAQNVLLGGASAGGLAAIHHCDRMRALVPQAQRLKCLSDSGFFNAAKLLSRAQDRMSTFGGVVQYHKLSNYLPKSCTSKMNASWCIFPENIIESIQTPFFAIESAFDSWKVKVSVAPSYRNGTTLPDWKDCVSNTTLCTPPQLIMMRHFGATLIDTMQKKFGDSPKRGMFVHSCYIHGASHLDHSWSKEPVVNGKTIGQTFGDWYMDRSTSVMVVDTKNTYPVYDCGVPIYL